MQKLLVGLHHFQSTIFREQRELFERLSAGQQPLALFITCSDSRINPNMITQTDPGELFILRNAGNIVPPYGASGGGEGATIEYAVAGLNIQDIIVCGHSECGAMKALLNPADVERMPAMRKWLGHADATKWIMDQKYPDRKGHAQLMTAVEENVLVQIENLRTHPSVAAGMANGKLKVHGWVYKIQTGEVFSYHPDRQQFLPMTEVSPVFLQVPEHQQLLPAI